jgi:hypothetical protein
MDGIAHSLHSIWTWCFGKCHKSTLHRDSVLCDANRVLEYRILAGHDFNRTKRANMS